MGIGCIIIIIIIIIIIQKIKFLLIHVQKLIMTYFLGLNTHMMSAK